MSETVICHYRVAAGSEPEFEVLLDKRMDSRCEARGDKPNMEFPHVSPMHG